MNPNSYFIYRLGEFIALHIPRKLAYRLAEFLSWLHYMTSRVDRHCVFNNLKAIIIEKSDKEILRLSLEVFKNFGRYLVDFFRSEEITKDYIKKHIKVDGLNYVEEALNKGKGVIVVSAHIGNWELSGIFTACLGYPLSVVAMVHKDERIDKFFNDKREKKGIRVIQLGRAFRQCIQHLKENRMLALVGDREFTQGGVVVDFLGKKAILPKGPAFLSLKTGAPIVLGFFIREKDNSFHFIFEPIIIEPVNTGNATEDTYNLINRYIPIIEKYIKKYPQQWLMFRQFWI